MTATAEANDNQTREGAPVKDLYEIGEIPPLGHIPKNMYAWTIRRERWLPPFPLRARHERDRPED